MAEWEESKIKDFAEVKGGKRLPKGKQLTSVPTKHPYIRIRDLGKSKYLELNSEIEFVDDETQLTIARYIVNTGDILISVVGTIGLIGIVGESLDKANQTENCDKIINCTGIEPEYLYYYLISPLGQEEIKRGTVGAVQPKLPLKNVLDINVKYPAIAEQRKIVEILKNVDEKISINEHINNNLEQQARALYKSWFVDFEPFNYSIPSDWKYGKLKDVLKLNRNSIKAGENTELPYLPIDIIPMKTFAVSEFKPNDEAKSSLVTFSKNDILIGAMRVYFHRVAIAPCDGITRTTCFTLTPHNSEYLCFGLLCCDQDSSIEYAQTTSKGSTMPYAVWDGGLGDMEILIPPTEVANKFNNLVLPMLEKIQDSYFENDQLRKMRDYLLPKLMSGELDVSDIDL